MGIEAYDENDIQIIYPGGKPKEFSPFSDDGNKVNGKLKITNLFNSMSDLMAYLYLKIKM